MYSELTTFFGRPLCSMVGKNTFEIATERSPILRASFCPGVVKTDMLSQRSLDDVRMGSNVRYGLTLKPSADGGDTLVWFCFLKEERAQKDGKFFPETDGNIHLAGLPPSEKAPDLLKRVMNTVITTSRFINF
ncbi:unnamed protein product [Calypogeia fissa]